MENTKPSKALHITLWAVQVILAAMFIMAGFIKSTTPIDKLHTMMSWTTAMPEGMVRFIAISELLGGLGLLLPALFRIWPHLTAWAAAGLAAIMIFATVFHISRGETSTLPINVIMLSLSVFIAWGRFKKAPIAAKA